jgi:hypothetical protein
VETAREGTRRSEATKVIQGDPFVQDLVTMFDGKVVESTIRPGGGRSQ